MKSSPREDNSTPRAQLDRGSRTKTRKGEWYEIENQNRDGRVRVTGKQRPDEYLNHTFTRKLHFALRSGRLRRHVARPCAKRPRQDRGRPPQRPSCARGGGGCTGRVRSNHLQCRAWARLL